MNALLADDAPTIELIDVSRRFVSPTGASLTALRDFSMTVRRGEFVAIVGPTGCGKSTTLNLITGIAKANAGQVNVMGKPVSGNDPRIGFVFQTDALFPWRSVLRNVAAGPLFVTHDLEEAIALADRVYMLTAGPATVKAVSSRSRAASGKICATKCRSATRARSWRRREGPMTIERITLNDAPRRRSRLVLTLRLAILIVFLGGWELGSRTHLIDPFFFAMPSTIVQQLSIWITEGTSQGPLWGEVLVTLEETVLGFLIGAVLGIVCGIVLGRDKLLADVFSIYIKVANSKACGKRTAP